MKRHYLNILLPLALAAFALSSCISDDTDFSDIINAGKEIEVKSIELDYTDLDEATESIDDADNDYVENSSFAYQIAIAFSGTTATVSGDVDDVSVSVSGAHVTVDSNSKEVEYILSGSTTDGGLKIYSQNKFKLTLNGVTITNPSGAAINNQCGKHMYVVLPSGTVNTLTDGTDYSYSGSEDEKGCLFSEGQVVFSGSGELRVYGNHRHAIASDDYIVFRPGCKFYVNSSAGHGIKANDGIDIRGSVINVEVTKSAAKGINSEANVDISGGRTTIITSGESLIEGNDTSSCAAVKCDSTFTMTAGKLNMKSSGMGGKGINSTMSISIKGGEINSVALGEKGIGAPKSIKSDEDITITGGTIYSYSAYSKPLDAAGTLTVASGWTTYEADDRLVVIQY